MEQARLLKNKQRGAVGKELGRRARDRAQNQKQGWRRQESLLESWGKGLGSGRQLGGWWGTERHDGTPWRSKSAHV